MSPHFIRALTVRIAARFARSVRGASRAVSSEANPSATASNPNRLRFTALALFAALALGLTVLPALADTAPAIDFTTDGITNITETSAHLQGEINPENGPSQTEWRFQYASDEAGPWSDIAAGSGVLAGDNATFHTVTADLTGLSADTVYYARLLASNEGGAKQTASAPVELETHGPPTAGTASVHAIGPLGSIGVFGAVNPHGIDTKYYFEYGRDSSYGESAPVPAADAGSGIAAVGVAQSLSGLEPGAEYHFRLVAESSAAGGVTIHGADQSFIAPPSSSPAEPTTCPNEARRIEQHVTGLPDCRAYEMVSPPDKHGGEIDGGLISGYALKSPDQAALDGNAVTFASQASFAGAAAALPLNQYLARRDPASGWSTQPLDPPQNPPGTVRIGTGEDSGQLLQDGTGWSLYQAFLPDLSQGFLVATDPAPVPGAPQGYYNPYARNLLDGSYRLLSPVNPPSWPPGPGSIAMGEERGLAIAFAGSSADGSHVIFAANDALTPDAVAGKVNLYEAFPGGLRLVSIRPDGTTDPAAGAELLRFGGGPGGDGLFPGHDSSNAISTDGSHIFWTGSDGQLYLREGGTTTVRVSASQKTNGSGPNGIDPDGPQPALYSSASTDGATVFFLSKEELTNDANTGPADNRFNLYRYEAGSGTLTDLTPDANPADPYGAAVEGVLGASEDGSYVYFAAEGILAAGAVSGDHNIYVAHDGTTSLIASVPRLNTGPLYSNWAEDTVLRTSRVSPNGHFLAFEAQPSLTGYNNHPPDPSDCSVSASNWVSGVCMEVFLYDAQANQLVCASCKPNGAPPLGNSIVPPPLVSKFFPQFDQKPGEFGWDSYSRQQRYLTDDGRLFFDSRDALTPADTNWHWDVYEYDAGQISLISPGTGTSDSQFVDASEVSGHPDDVFFVTHERLLPQDADGALDLYDARVGGGFSLAPSPPPPCEAAEACHRSAGPQPGSPLFSSETFVAPPERRCPRGFSARHGHCLKRHPKRHRHHERRRHHKRAAHANRETPR